MSATGSGCNLETYAKVVNLKLIQCAANFLLDFGGARMLQGARSDQL
jgi:hypothetical protein